MRRFAPVHTHVLKKSFDRFECDKQCGHMLIAQRRSSIAGTIWSSSGSSNRPSVPHHNITLITASPSFISHIVHYNNVRTNKWFIIHTNFVRAVHGTLDPSSYFRFDSQVFSDSSRFFCRVSTKVFSLFDEFIYRRVSGFMCTLNRS